MAAFAELLHRVSAMIEDIPEIAELDLHPVFVLLFRHRYGRPVPRRATPTADTQP